LSEGSCAGSVNPLDGPRKPGPVALPIARQTIRIVDTEGCAVADGQPGEMVIKGPNVMRGYLNGPEETAKTVVDGWLHAGDVGRRTRTESTHGAEADARHRLGGNGFGSPRMVHTIYIAKLVIFYALGGVLVATLTSGLPFSMFHSGGTSPSSTRRPCCGGCCWN
jgi:acyl-CoA synthetase (AMP-forming)/AMP-acid ligase II